jgi:hypothetical protein
MWRTIKFYTVSMIILVLGAASVRIETPVEGSTGAK